METDPSIQAIKAAWQSQEPEQLSVQLTAVKAASNKFEGKIRRRNRVEYTASIFVVISFGFIAWASPSHAWLTKLGALMIIASVFYIAWHLHRHGSAGRAQPDASAQSLVHFHRGQLIRQRDLIRSVWRWYLGPMVPGLVVMMMGRWFQDHAHQRSIAADHLVIALSSIIVAAVFIIVGLLNTLGAVRLQRQIDELDRLLGE